MANRHNAPIAYKPLFPWPALLCSVAVLLAAFAAFDSARNRAYPATAAQAQYAKAACARESGTLTQAFVDHGVRLDEDAGTTFAWWTWKPRLIVQCAFGRGVTSTEINYIASATDVPALPKHAKGAARR